MFPSNNSNNKNLNTIPNNLYINNILPNQQNNIININNYKVPPNNNQQKVLNQNQIQGAQYYSNRNNPLNNIRSTLQQNHVVNTNVTFLMLKK